MGFLDGEVDLYVTAPVHVDELFISPPPDKKPIRKILLARRRVEETPAITVVYLEP
jgi:hypothetical protein